jgi:hypothetical protein
MIAKLSEMAAPPTAVLEVVSPIVTHEPEMQDVASECWGSQKKDRCELKGTGLGELGVAFLFCALGALGG